MKRPGAATWMARALVGIAVFWLTLLTASYHNDHVMHVVLGQQMLAGRLPVRGCFDPGIPLMDGLSTAAQMLFGYRLLSEAVIVAAALAVAHAATRWLCARLPAIARHVQRCTGEQDRVLMKWFAPEILYDANRRFTGWHSFVLAGFWNAPADVMAARDLVLSDRPALVLMRGSNRFPSGVEAFQAWFDLRHRLTGVVQDRLGPIEVQSRRDLVSVGRDPELGLPCYR